MAPVSWNTSANSLTPTDYPKPSPTSPHQLLQCHLATPVPSSYHSHTEVLMLPENHASISPLHTILHSPGQFLPAPMPPPLWSLPLLLLARFIFPCSGLPPDLSIPLEILNYLCEHFLPEGVCCVHLKTVSTCLCAMPLEGMGCSQLFRDWVSGVWS